MKYAFRFSVSGCCAILLAVFIFTLPVTGQQSGSAPSIKLISPVIADSTNTNGTIFLKAEIVTSSPVRTFRVYNNRKSVLSGTQKDLTSKDSNTLILESFIHLNKGKNIIDLDVKNGTSSASSEKLSIFCKSEPFVIWILPSAASSTVESATTIVKAQIKTNLPVQKVGINLNNTLVIQSKDDIKSVGNETYIFEKSIQLQPGKNTVYITCENSNGVTNSVTRYITNSYDKLPEIKIISPAGRDSLNNTGRAVVKAEIVSRSPIKSYKLYKSYKVEIAESGNKLTQKDSSTYVLETLIPLNGGINSINIEATNNVGTAGSERLRINYQLQPFVTWVMPSSENSNVNDESITLRAEIKSGIALQRTIINVNGVSITDENALVSSPEKDFYTLEKNIQLKSGKNIVYITSVNSKGETTSAERYINCNSGAIPVISLISPAPNDSLNNEGSVAVNAQIVSKLELGTYRIFNNRTVVYSESAAKLEKKDNITYLVKSLIPLQAGVNTIFVEARNSAGMGTSVRRNITCQLEPIITWILPSSASSNFEAGNMTIKAEVKSIFDISGVSININGNMTDIDKGMLKRADNNIWILEKTISLGAGINNLTLVANNMRGAGKSAIRQVNYIPGVRPEINWILPAALNTETDKAEFQISASIIAKSQVQAARLFINGTELTDAGRSKVSQRSPQESTYENSVTLKTGENKLKLTAVADAQTVSSEERIITYTVPALPELVWRNPTPDRTEINKPSLDIRMDIKSSTSLSGVSVYLNGKALKNIDLQNGLRKEDSFLVLENAIPLGAGDNNIYITASNKAGMAKSEMRSVKYVVETKPEVSANVTAAGITETRQVTSITSSAPVFSWVSPSIERNNINESNPRIKIKINSSDKVQSLLLYVNGVASETVNELRPTGTDSEYLLERSVNLNPGENNIYLVATNSGGPTRSDLRYLTNPPTTRPVVSWYTPKDQKTVAGTELVMIEACIQSATELKNVWVLVNGNRQGVESFFPPSREGDCNYRFTNPVILSEGDNTVYIYAENFAGSRPSEARVIKYQKTMIAEKRIALVIGNADYGTSSTLKNPVKDANLMDVTLKSLNFDVIKKINATKVEMEGAIREFSEKLPEYNVALFYYAGHGVQVNGQNYLVPVDAKLTKQTDCQWEAIDVNNTITKQFEQVPENINIIILDACRDNPFRSWSRGGVQGFRALSPVSGTIVSFATSENSVAADGQGENGPFTEELVRQMNIPQTIEAVFKNTRREVMKRTNNAQRPQEWNMLTGDFYFKK